MRMMSAVAALNRLIEIFNLGEGESHGDRNHGGQGCRDCAQ